MSYNFIILKEISNDFSHTYRTTLGCIVWESLLINELWASGERQRQCKLTMKFEYKTWNEKQNLHFE